MPVVLVVDGVPENRLLVARALAHLGCQLLTESLGQQVLARMQGDRPDAVILDVCLPDGDGLAICRTIKAAPGGQDVPILLSVRRTIWRYGCRPLKSAAWILLSGRFTPRSWWRGWVSIWLCRNSSGSCGPKTGVCRRR
ncbi:MAG: response regulator [Oscillatoriales cyanobacterium SM2_1_8]|nr:response regulator [Oscillatoriales cyanobacterium SM2_1_8]